MRSMVVLSLVFACGAAFAQAGKEEKRNMELVGTSDLQGRTDRKSVV